MNNGNDMGGKRRKRKRFADYFCFALKNFEMRSVSEVARSVRMIALEYPRVFIDRPSLLATFSLVGGRASIRLLCETACFTIDPWQSVDRETRALST